MKLRLKLNRSPGDESRGVGPSTAIEDTTTAAPRRGLRRKVDGLEDNDAKQNTSKRLFKDKPDTKLNAPPKLLIKNKSDHKLNMPKHLIKEKSDAQPVPTTSRQILAPRKMKRAWEDAEGEEDEAELEEEGSAKPPRYKRATSRYNHGHIEIENESDGDGDEAIKAYDAPLAFSITGIRAVIENNSSIPTQPSRTTHAPVPASYDDGASPFKPGWATKPFHQRHPVEQAATAAVANAHRYVYASQPSYTDGQLAADTHQFVTTSTLARLHMLAESEPEKLVPGGGKRALTAVERRFCEDLLAACKERLRVAEEWEREREREEKAVEDGKATVVDYA